MSLSTMTVSCGRTTGEAKERGRSPAQIPFLFVSKLHSMLQDCDKDPDGKGTIVSWISEGKAFRVHKRKVFVETILPSYFNQTKYKSFQRQRKSRTFALLLLPLMVKPAHLTAYNFAGILRAGCVHFVSREQSICGVLTELSRVDPKKVHIFTSTFCETNLWSSIK